ncbi:hypothetical protein [Macrococcus lamae]|uniref:Uncharacterized protein n=1 Tax=Macrococcus lamae TaxID=198484 RepID=A0A4V3BEP1_9STAP|nr:hypothetical protein [Macrococcus lamae]TDM05147.1 hypothetical protein ERX29_10670 [Macrococcus lamae]
MISDFHDPFEQVSYCAVRKGMRCPSCRNITDFNCHQRLFLCLACKTISSLDEIFVQSAREYLLIYPERKLTKSSMYLWCNKKIPPAKVSTLLKQHFKLQGRTKGSHYRELNIP